MCIFFRRSLFFQICQFVWVVSGLTQVVVKLHGCWQSGSLEPVSVTLKRPGSLTGETIVKLQRGVCELYTSELDEDWSCLWIWFTFIVVENVQNCINLPIDKTAACVARYLVSSGCCHSVPPPETTTGKQYDKGNSWYFYYLWSMQFIIIPAHWPQRPTSSWVSTEGASRELVISLHLVPGVKSVKKHKSFCITLQWKATYH